jgi:iron complex transport system substrate-binding protein
MIRCLRALLVALLAVTLATAATARSFTDSAGRTVDVPDRIERVFAAGPPASIMVYALAPDRLIGWTRAPRADERGFLAAPYGDLPETGRLTGRANTANVESVVASRPDLILDVGSTDPTYVSLADRIEAQTGIPYVLVDGRLDNTAAALRMLGGLLGAEKRADALASYADETLRMLDERLRTVPPDKRRRVYYVRSPSGLETALGGSINVEAIERAGGINVAAAAGRGGLATVSREQVLLWDPEVIVTLDDRFLATAATDPVWRAVRAVREGRVYAMPKLPFGWLDSPPAMNRLIGLRWLAKLLYPDRFPEDLHQTVRDFYRLFYHVDLDETQLSQLLPQK